MLRAAVVGGPGFLAVQAGSSSQAERLGLGTGPGDCSVPWFGMEGYRVFVENIAQVSVLVLGFVECGAPGFEFKRSREFVKIFGQVPVLDIGLVGCCAPWVEFKRN